MGNTNMDRKEERNLLGDLTQGRPNLRFISEFDEISFYNGRFSKKRFIKWLVELETNFNFNNVPHHKNNQFSCDARE